MKLVLLESPYAANGINTVEDNENYARLAVYDCLQRKESPIVSHLLFTQRGVLNDLVPEDRKLGIKAGHAWLPVCDAVVVYADRGISRGMQVGINKALKLKKRVEYRYLY